MGHNWQERKRPIRLERKYIFADYETLRDYLDQAADISEKLDLYPDMGFGKDYVNITIHADEDDGELKEIHHNLANELETLSKNFIQETDS